MGRLGGQLHFITVSGGCHEKREVDPADKTRAASTRMATSAESETCKVYRIQAVDSEREGNKGMRDMK
jgi:hypothetical protein